MVIFNSVFFKINFLLLITGLFSCTSPKHTMQELEQQLTFDTSGHFLNIRQCVSADGNWVVYDTRNDDSKIGSTGAIEMVNTKSKEIKQLYKTENQTEYGPGVGAVTFSPVKDEVIFIHGLKSANKEYPYTFTRRTGVAIETDKPFRPIYMDARDVSAPFTAGALRGGTHAHSWSGDGKMISFTYNDEVIERFSVNHPATQDLRTVGVMFPKKVSVNSTGSSENYDGEMYAVVITEVTENPKPNSDEIDKAFDECWVGKDGYLKSDGTVQKKAIAFQGNLRNKEGKTITEVFIADLPADLTIARPGLPLEGTNATRPNVPQGVNQRRITFTENGIKGVRHWLCASPDGSQIVFLAEDENGTINIFGVSPNGGEIKKISNHQSDVLSGPNYSPDGKYLAYLADSAVCITEVSSGKHIQITSKSTEENMLSGSIVWSPNGSSVFYNRKIITQEKAYYQIFRTDVKLNF